MSDRVNLCKVSPELRERLSEIKGDQTWPNFQEEVADHFERGIDIDIEYADGRSETRTVDLGESTDIITNFVSISIKTGDHGYECDDCERTLPLGQIIVNGNRTVCIECSTAEDRIIS